MKIISNYDNAVLNPDMYGSYIELYWYLKKNFYNSICEFYTNSLLPDNENNYKNWNLIRKLEEACSNVDYSFQNRFYQSYWTSEVLEVNIDYSGGLQNLITSYDSCVKVINNCFMPKNLNSSFVYIRSNHEVSAGESVIQFNYLHLIQPYIFSAVVMHELTNLIFEKWYNNKYDKSNRDCERYFQQILKLLCEAQIELKSEISYSSNKYDILFTENELKEALDYLQLVDGEKLIKLTSADSLRYFLIDSINYVHGYNRKFDIFKTTSWAYYLQLGNAYDCNNSLNEADFVIMYFRISLVKRFFNLKNDVVPFEFKGTLSKLENKLSNKINYFIDWLFISKRVKNWFADWKSILDEKKAYSILPQIEVTDEIESLNKTINKYLFKPKYSFELVYTQLNTISNLDNNKLMQIYKNIIFQTLEHTRIKLGILERSTDTGEPQFSNDPELFKKMNEKILIDPCGGTFIVGRNNRHNYYIFREKFIRLMFHLSQVHKKMYTVDILSQ